MAGLAGLISLLETAITDVNNIRYCGVAASALVTYEYLLTLDQEIELVWKSRWSLGKLLFFVNRYYIILCELVFFDYGAFSPNISDTFCLHWFRWTSGSSIATFSLAQFILQLRLYALYGKSKSILALMVISFAAAIAAASTLLAIRFKRVTVSAHVIPGLPFCIPAGDFRFLWAFWIPFLISDSLLFGLAVFRGFRIHKLQGTLFRSRNRLVEFFIRDSVLYFMVIFVVYLGNAITFILAPEPFWECTAIFMIVTTSVLVNRLILNVRGMLHPDNATPVTNVAKTPTFLTTVQSQPRSSEPQSTLRTEATAIFTEDISADHWESRVIDIRGPHVGSVHPSEYEMSDMERGGGSMSGEYR